MKLVIASDIHGSATWCSRLLEVIEAEQPDMIVLLGDLLYHGPRNPLPDGYAPAEVAAMLNRYADRIIAVRGNCDSEVDQMILDFPCMGDYSILVDGTKRLFFTHGHVYQPDNLPKLPQGSAFIYGHTHVRRNDLYQGIHLVNPGSIALPKDDVRGYALYENGTFELRDL